MCGQPDFGSDFGKPPGLGMLLLLMLLLLLLLLRLLLHLLLLSRAYHNRRSCQVDLCCHSRVTYRTANMLLKSDSEIC